jgi:L-fuculose-phosphate aldolase
LSAALEELACACRVLAQEGHNDLTLGHLSLRDSAGRGFWLKRSGIGLDEVIGPDDFVLLSFSGERLAGVGGVHMEWPIHAGILSARPDAAVVGHTHSPWATRLSASPEPLLPVANYGAAFAGRLPRFENTSDLIGTQELGEALARALGDDTAVLIRNHGSVFCGRSTAEAVVTAVWLERAAADALTVGQSGIAVTVPSKEELEAKRGRILAPATVDGFWAYFRRRLEAAEAGRA